MSSMIGPIDRIATKTSCLSDTDYRIRILIVADYKNHQINNGIQMMSNCQNNQKTRRLLTGKLNKLGLLQHDRKNV
jgi:hypothetical protein